MTSSVSTRLRLLVLGTAAATVSAVSAVAAPAYAATAAHPTDYATYTDRGWLQRWNPCEPLHYRTDTRLVPSALATVRSAVAQVSKATGITFAYDGATAYTPVMNGSNQPASLVVSFARHNGQAGGSNYLAGGSQLGEGGFQSSYQTLNGKITTYKITKGYAVIDAANYNKATAKVKTATLLHELGHAVGLNHARYTGEVMYPVIANTGAGAYSSGDLAGLKKVGRSAGCLS